MILLIAAITPAVIFLYIIYSKDTEKEPWSLLMKCFFGGVLSAVPAILLASVFSSLHIPGSALWNSFYMAFFQAAIPEELAKFAILYWIVWKHKEFDQHYDGIIYAVFVSLGFATLENILYVAEGGLGVALSRAVLSVPGHGFWGVFMGYFLALARFSPKKERRRYMWLSILSPIVLHGLFDFYLFYASSENISWQVILLMVILFTALIIFFWRRGLKKIRKHVAKDKKRMEAISQDS